MKCFIGAQVAQAKFAYVIRSQVNLYTLRNIHVISQEGLAPERNSPKSAEISERQKERNTQDLRSVYVNLWIMVAKLNKDPNFGRMTENKLK